MSACYLRNFNLKMYRQAIFMGKCRLLPSYQGSRAAHNNLYQMVKKRTLEARTKGKPAQFPDNQPCVSGQEAKSPFTSKPKTPTPDDPMKRAPYPNPRDSKPLSSTPNKQSNTPPPNKSDDPRAKICQNTRVLSAIDPKGKDSCKDDTKGTKADPPESKIRADANMDSCKEPCAKQRGGTDDCGKDGKGGKEKGGMDTTTKALLGVLAALGAGGLLFWLFSKNKDNECPTGDKATEEVRLPAPVPVKSSDLPEHVPYLLIGGGTASFSAFRAIKSNDPKAKVLMITNEHKKPYMRPPLSKELWYSTAKGDIPKDYRFKQWTGVERSLFFEPDEFFIEPTKLMDSTNGGIAVAQGFQVKKIDPAKHTVELSDGYKISYNECLIATGCSPKNLIIFDKATPAVKEKIMVYRTPDDFERLKRYADQKKSITIIGNGFTGSELACSLANYTKDRKVRIYQIFQESGNMSRILPDYLSKWTMKKVEELGVCVLPNSKIKSVKRNDQVLELALDNGNTILTDIVVTCVGCEPNTSLANGSGLEIDPVHGGLVVNAELEARRNLFVAGDVSSFYDPLLGRRRVEHHDHSVISGRLAGENMVGKKKAYTHQSMFWSDLGPDIGYEGIGLVDNSLPTVGVFALASKVERKSDNLSETSVDAAGTPSTENLPDVSCETMDPENYGRGVIFYLKEGKVVGILLWNLFNRIGLARTIINQNKKFEDLNEVAKLFEIHA